MPLHVHVYTPTAYLQSSIPLRLNFYTPTRLQRTSRAPYLHVCMRAARLHRSSSLLFASTPALLQPASVPPHLQQARMPPPHYTYSVPPELLRQTPPRLYACSASPPFNTSTSARSAPPEASHLHVCTPAAYLQSFIHLYLHRHISRLHSSAPPRLHRASRAHELPFLHTYTPAARLPSSRAPYLYTSSSARHQSSRAPYIHVCTPASRLQSSRAPIPPHLHPRSARPELPSSIPLHVYVCTPPELPSSIPPRLHSCSTTPELPFLHTYTLAAPSRAPELHTSTPLRLRASRAPELHTSTSDAYSTSPYSSTSSSLHLQRASKAPQLLVLNTQAHDKLSLSRLQ